MDLKINWYTSYFQKMSTRSKQDNDIYIQVSRSVVCYAKDKNGDAISKIIDFSELAELLGMYSDTLEEYYKQLDEYKDDIKEVFSSLIKEINENCKDVLFELDKECIREIGKKFDDLTDEDVKKYVDDDKNEFSDEEKQNINTKEDLINKYLCFNIFLLCHENLELQYTKKDEEKYNGQVKQGEYKQCHRRVLAKWLNDNLQLDVKEWNIAKENESIVYRDYF